MDDHPAQILTPGQKKLAGFTLSFACLILTGALLVFLVLLLGKLVSHFSSLLLPLTIAGVLALMLRPVVRAVEQRLRLSPVMAVVTLYGVLLVATAGLLSYLVPILFRQIGDFIELAPELFNRTMEWIAETFPQWSAVLEDSTDGHPLRELIEEFSGEIGEAITAAIPTLVQAGETLLAAVAMAIGLAIIPVYLFFFLKSDRDPTENLGEFLPFLNKDTREDVVFLAREFVNIVVSFFRGQLVIALIVGVLLAIGFAAAGLKFSVILGLILGLLNIVPYLGVIIGLLITVPTALFQPGGGWELALLVVGIFAVVQSLESALLTPKIMGDRTGLHPVTIIIAIFFWGIALGGILGMILAIPLTAFFVTAWRLVKSKYLSPREQF